MYMIIVHLGFPEGKVRGKYSITHRDMSARTQTSSHLIQLSKEPLICVSDILFERDYTAYC